MLRADRRLRPVDPKRHEAEERVEIEAAQTTDMTAHAEIALQKNRLGEEWDPERSGQNDEHDGRGGRLEPNDRGGGQHDLEARTENPTREHGERA